ncbi:MAG: DUF998 domain-containing protein [Candidatus Eremiobacteraeota bacterium]|nr:DUF998 domain-containing protein [Candidatus Eremiobacteraeota bacterium]
MTTRLRLGAIAWILTLQFFLIETYAGLGWPGYSFFTDRISDLGAANSPMHGLVNASLIVQGVLIGGGALLLREAFAPGRLRDLGIALIAMNGAGVILVGFVPEDSSRILHDIGATALFLSGNVGMLALGTALLHDASRMRALGTAAVVFGSIGVIAAIFFTLRSISAHAMGAFEHLAVDPLPLWLLMAALVVLYPGRRTLRD